MDKVDAQLTEIKTHTAGFLIRVRFVFISIVVALVLLVTARMLTENRIIKAQSDQSANLQIAGSQKMLTQRIALLSLALIRSNQDKTSDKIRETLKSEITAMITDEKTLLDNYARNGMSEKALTLINGNPETVSLNNQVNRFVSNATALANTPTAEIQIKDDHLRQVINLSSVLLGQFTSLSEILKEDGERGIRQIKVLSDSFAALTILAVLALWLLVLRKLIKKLGREFQLRTNNEEKLLRANQDLEQFASVAAHDIRGPLHNIKAFADILLTKKDVTAEQTDKYLGRITSGIQNLDDLLKDLLNYARSNSGELQLSRITLEELRENLRAEFIDPIEDKGLKLEIIEAGTGRSESLVADRTLLKVLFKNLISNSLKYQHADTPAEIKITYSKSAGVVKFKLQDNGPGFEPATINSVFKAFYRQRNVGEQSGSGLGLAICQQIVEKHRGRIAASNASGGSGAIITFTIPQKDSGRLKKSRKAKKT